jgi:hypothetical protein
MNKIFFILFSISSTIVLSGFEGHQNSMNEHSLSDNHQEYRGHGMGPRYGKRQGNRMGPHGNKFRRNPKNTNYQHKNIFNYLLSSNVENAYNKSFESRNFSGSDNCAMCHNNIYDSNGNDQSIESDWSATMMANSTKDPFWKAKVKSELHRNPQLSELINDKCTKCHAPMANTQSRANGDKPKLFDDGFFNQNNKYHDLALDGVSCTACHQIAKTKDFGTDKAMSGHYYIDTKSSGINKKIFGPYKDVFTRPMQNMVGYTPTYASHMSSSELCASCHNLKTPFVDEKGKVVANKEFPEQMVYSEWKHSSFNDNSVSSCKDCHMQQISSAIAISNRPRRNLTLRDYFSKHAFVGANSYMLDVLKNNADKLGTNGRDFDTMIKRTREFLRSSLKIAIIDSTIYNNILEVKLKISNLSGHKNPTSYPSRRVYIHFNVKDNQNNIVFESGATRNDGFIIGSDSDMDSSKYEPHYDVITKPSQVQIYEDIMQNTDNKVTYTLLRASSYTKDNRLLPKGFDKQTAPQDIAVVGKAKDDSNFIGGSDIITYKIDISTIKTTTFTIKAEINYQTISYMYLQDLYKDNLKEVKELKEYLKKTDIVYETIVGIKKDINIGD